ncbi:MAG: FAD-dependent oxidoreductase [Planctomycetales bacterium]
MNIIRRLPCCCSLYLVAAISLTACGAESPIHKSEFIFEQAPFPSCHASTIAETRDGLVAAWFGGTAESNPDVGIWVSLHRNGKWGPTVEVVNGVQPDGKRYACWNPVLFQPKSGPLMLFYKVGVNPRTWWGMLTKSKDGGLTWSAPQKLPDGFLGPIKNKPVQLPNGDILCPSSTERERDSGTSASPEWQIHFERTSDLGQTWTKSTPSIFNGINSIQPSILFLGGDELLSVGRTRRQDYIFSVRSLDMGKTWGAMYLNALPNPGSGTDAVTLRDGRQLIIYNHTTRGRSPLNLAISRDGKTWEAALTLENEPKQEFSYPAIIQTADGLVHMTYTWKRQRIKHVVVDPAQIKPQPFTDGNWPANAPSAVLSQRSPPPPSHKYDVVVIGGTPGGIAAAISAGRKGRRVLLAEYHPHLGAMSSSGLGASDIEKREMIQGIFREFVDRVYKHYLDRYGPDSEQVRLCKQGYWFEPSVAEQIFDRMVAEVPGITVLKAHQLEQVQKQGNRVVSVTLKDRRTGELRSITGDVFIDGTYEGDLYAKAGCEYRVGRESRTDFNEPHAGHIYCDIKSGQILGGTGAGDKKIPAYTFRLCITTDPHNQVPMTMPPPDYDRTRYLGYLEDYKTRPGKYPNLMQFAFTLRSLPNRKFDVNMKPVSLGFVFVEENAGYPDADWTERERITTHLRNLSLGLLWFLQNDEAVPEESRRFAKQYHLCKDEFADNGHFPFQLYVREARRLVGEYTLSERNITALCDDKAPRFHPDAIAVGEFPIDSFPIHKRQPGDTIVLEGYLGMLRKITQPYQLPYRIMIPKTVDGLIVPVAASTTHVAFSSVRLEPTWMALGQAAGLAADLALKHQVPPRNIPLPELQQELRTQHAVLEIPGVSKCLTLPLSPPRERVAQRAG